MDQKPVIKLDFSDFWPSFCKENNYFIRLLSRRYEIELTSRPDFLIYSVYGERHRRYRCVRILYTSESVRPDFVDCDFAFSFDFIPNQPNQRRHYRLPIYALYEDLHRDRASLLDPKPAFDAIRGLKTRFCNIVVSNPRATKRIEFFQKISRYKQVDSGGRHLNNVGGPVKDKLAFQSRYKFTIAFENASYPGYTTEKILEPLLVHSIPIYWGNPLIHRDFNPRSFVNWHDYKDDDQVIERVIEIDSDETLWEQYVKESCYDGNHVNEFVDPENVLRQFDAIFSNRSVGVANTWEFSRRYWQSRVNNFRASLRTARRLRGPRDPLVDFISLVRRSTP